LSRVLAFDAEMVLPFAPSALPGNQFFVGISYRKGFLAFRLAPDAPSAALFALIDQPVVVAFVNDVPLGRIERRGPDASVELAIERRLGGCENKGLDVERVAAAPHLLPGNAGEDALVAQAQQIAVDADIAVGRGSAERRVIARRAARLCEIRLIELQHLGRITLVQKI